MVLHTLQNMEKEIKAVFQQVVHEISTESSKIIHHQPGKGHSDYRNTIYTEAIMRL